jgi:two-component system NtrC family sensor kinase
MIGGGILFWYLFFKHDEKKVIEESISHAESFVKIVKKTVRFGMLTNHRENIQYNVESVVSLDEVNKIRIFDDRGVVFYSSEKNEIGHIVNKESVICRTCHNNPDRPGGTLCTEKKWFIYINNRGKRGLKFVEPLYNEPSCSTAGCHFHSQQHKVLGLLDMDFPLEPVYKTVSSRKWKIIFFGIVFFFVTSLALLLILWKLVSQPVSVLVEGMKKVAQGDLNHWVRVTSQDEMGMLSDNFNTMIKELAKSRETMDKWTQSLENEIAKKSEEIQKAHRQLIQAEKLASLGQLAAGVAHELNNPLTGVISFAHFILQRTPETQKEDRNDLEIIIEQAERCAKIIKSLLTFSRIHQTDKHIININDVVKDTLEMIKTNEKFYHISFNIQSSTSPLYIKGDATQLQQVFLNILINAADAMKGKGNISLITRIGECKEGLCAEIILSDTGPGIPETEIEKIFEPFFTTKPVGKGTGLGLSVSHGIVKNHGGTIDVSTIKDKGTTFSIKIPLIEGY